TLRPAPPATASTLPGEWDFPSGFSLHLGGHKRDAPPAGRDLSRTLHPAPPATASTLAGEWDFPSGFSLHLGGHKRDGPP
ncbi:hypothetical protein NDU88_002668, partial [Pleurodeles waltl]